MGARSFTPERIADRLQIEDVVHRVCRAVDRKAFHLLRDLYHPDATDSRGLFEGGVEEFIAWVEQRHEHIELSLHHLTTMIVDFTGPHRAVVETYCWGIQRYSPEARDARSAIGAQSPEQDSSIDMLMSGRYVDRFERRQGEWRIAHRTLAFEHTMRRSVPADGPSLDPAWVLGQRNESDVVFQELSSFRGP